MIRLIGFFLCMGLSLLCAGYGGYALLFNDKVPDYVVVDDCRVHPENEGKYVLMSGKPAFTGIVEDPLFGVRVKAPALKREVKMYQYINSGTTQNPSMSKGWSKKHEPAFEVKSGHRYSNPTFPVRSEDFGGEMTFNDGDLKIDKQYAPKFTYTHYVEFKDKYTHCLVTVKKLPYKKLPKEYINKGDSYYRQADGGKGNVDPKIGDISISYKALLVNKLPECTIIAKQVNGVLTKDDKAIFVDRVLSPDEIKRQYRSNSRSACMGALICAGVLFCVGIALR